MSGASTALFVKFYVCRLWVFWVVGKVYTVCSAQYSHTHTYTVDLYMRLYIAYRRINVLSRRRTDTNVVNKLAETCFATLCCVLCAIFVCTQTRTHATV